MALTSTVETARPGDQIARAVAAAGRIVVGKEHEIRMALACLLAQGHLLIEDRPGVGKTTLAHVLARVLGLGFRRVQFTSDLLPADILGVAIYREDSGHFEFHRGPIFAQVVLADEVNRATPKTQSALLEAMEEHQVTVEGESRALPEPFFVIATQNPVQQIGTFPLPESQLDRFLMRLRLGYPNAEAERDLLRGRDRREMIEAMEPVMGAEELQAIQAQVPEVHTSEALLSYAQALLAHTRESPAFRVGLSPRAGLALVRSAQAWALVNGRTHVIPEDIQAVLPAVVGHRLIPADDTAGTSGDDLAEALLSAVAIP